MNNNNSFKVNVLPTIYSGLYTCFVYMYIMQTDESVISIHFVQDISVTWYIAIRVITPCSIANNEHIKQILLIIGSKNSLDGQVQWWRYLVVTGGGWPYVWPQRCTQSHPGLCWHFLWYINHIIMSPYNLYCWVFIVWFSLYKSLGGKGLGLLWVLV